MRISDTEILSLTKEEGKIMKKIATKILTVIAACAAMVFASCAQPSTNPENGGNLTYTEVWSTGATVTDWDTICSIDHEKFSSDVKTIRVTYSGVGVDACFKPTVSEPWTAGVFSSAEGAVIAADNGVGQLNAAGGTVVLTFKPEMLTKVIGEGRDGAWGGLTFQGQNVTLNKIEIGK